MSDIKSMLDTLRTLESVDGQHQDLLMETSLTELNMKSVIDRVKRRLGGEYHQEISQTQRETQGTMRDWVAQRVQALTAELTRQNRDPRKELTMLELAKLLPVGDRIMFPTREHLRIWKWIAQAHPEFSTKPWKFKDTQRVNEIFGRYYQALSKPVYTQFKQTQSELERLLEHPGVLDYFSETQPTQVKLDASFKTDNKLNSDVRDQLSDWEDGFDVLPPAYHVPLSEMIRKKFQTAKQSAPAAPVAP